MKLPQLSLRDLFWLMPVCAIGSCMAGCWWANVRPPNAQAKNLLTGTHEEVRTRLLKVIPIGTDATQAQSRLEKFGFNVSAGHKPESLFADLQEPAQSFVTKRWMVVVDVPDNAVADIQVNSGFTGP